MAMNRPLATLSIVAASALALAGCASADDPEGSDDASDGGASAETVSFTFEASIGDEDDPEYVEQTVEVPKNPESVVIFDMASLDSWGSLGGHVAGAPLDSVPDYLTGYLDDDAVNVGSLFEADLIAIEALQPDLIIIGGRSSAQYEALTQITDNVIDVTSDDPFEEQLERNITFFGEVLGHEEEAAEAIETLETGIAEAREVTAGIGTGLSILVSGDRISALTPSDGDYSGRNLRGGIVYDVFGVEPVHADIAAATHGEPISFEFLVDQDPDYIFVTDRNAGTGDDSADAAEVVLDNEVVHRTSAWQNDHIVYLDPTAWYIVFGGIETTQIMIDDIMSIAE